MRVAYFFALMCIILEIMNSILSIQKYEPAQNQGIRRKIGGFGRFWEARVVLGGGVAVTLELSVIPSGIASI